ncbi:Gfo/Idh/MocA family oxidoreductase [candidate division KSB1 bacterium]|nr:Gfo/Idh/MocA family oxidoreductase [candidate division KSB1 bacterium]
MLKIKTGIIGCGKVGRLHAAGLINVPESEFTAVCSRSPEKAQSFAQKYHVKAYTDVIEMIEKSGVEMVTIATPHPAHAVPSLEAMKAGTHVLVDKPLASSLADCDAMIQNAKKYSRKLGTISQRRLYPPVQRIRQAIDAGKIGKPILGTVTMLGWRDEAYYKSDSWRGKWIEEGGGVLVNQAPHQLDILQWVMGPIESLFGIRENLNHPYIEVEDTAVAVIRFKNGGVGNIVVSNSQNPALYGKVHVHGSNGASIGVQTDGGAMFIAGMSSILEPPYNEIWTIPGEEQNLEKWKKEDADFFNHINPMEYFHQLQIQDFLQAIIADRPPMISGEEGRKTVELFTAIYRSQRDNKPIQFPLEPENERNDFDGRLS